MSRPVDAAILAALDQGLTTKAGALAQAYWSLRGSGHWVPREQVEWAWARLTQEGRIARTGRAWTIVEVTDVDA